MFWTYVGTFVGGVVFWAFLGDVILHGIAKAFHAAADFFDEQSN